MVRRREVLTLALCTACATAGGPRVSADDLRLVDSLFTAYSGPLVPGASVVVIREGRVVVRRAYGMADLEHRGAATPETDYRLASVSKQFTAMAVMLLAKDGRLRYDQPVRDFLPELPAATGSVTVRHLLNHTSGLWDYEDLIPESRTAQLDDRDVLALLGSKDSLYFPAGSQYRYSNTGYVLLGLIVARVSGMSFPEFLRARIFLPLGMGATVAHVEGSDTIPRRAYGYSPRGGAFVQTDQSVTSATLGDGGIYTNVDDMTRWDQARDGGATELVDAATMELATTPPQLPAGATTQYGFGWFVDNYRGEKRWRHTGETSGFRNAIQRFPRRRLTVIVLTNRSSGEPDAIAERIADRLLFR
ncbi:MAG TPA: serine hydrolase domain-containing protein [Gemmatimonadales bacterium]|nr:serine hydrolase domain-containing protein [Gemmatimonadales bacterium]